MISMWQNVPEYLNPIFLSIGGFAVYWYSVMWIAAFGICYGLLSYRLRRNEGNYEKEFIQDVFIYALFGAIIGGRIGYVIFYDLAYYVAHPLLIFSPYDPSSGVWTGIYGMSYHGGLIGVICAIAWIVRGKKMSILRFFDFVVPAIPLGYFFGRIGNFFNQELVGRVTTSQWGMYFNDEIVRRHPSQLYEAFFEGVVLFAILWSVRNKKWRVGVLSGIYLIGYAVMRFVTEFFREPDAHLGMIFLQLSMGQVLSLVMMLCGSIFLIVRFRKKSVDI